MTVSFPFAPVKAGNISLVDGVRKDVDDFRVMVGLLVNDHIQQKDLSIDLKYFFSNIFIEHIVDPSEMLECACYQLFHPIFFHGRDRLDFFNLLTEFRERVQNEFQGRFKKLEDPAYELKGWKSKVTDQKLLKCVNKVIKQNSSATNALYYADIHRFIRNVYTHCLENEKHDEWEKLSLKDYDLKLSRQFPGICSKILDMMIRTEPRDSIVSQFVKFFEEPPNGFNSKMWQRRS